MIYFLHIPKTAGTTVTSILKTWFSPNEIAPAILWNEAFHAGINNFDQYNLITGHFGYGLHYNTKKKIEYITFLRNPAERTVSQFNHMLQDSKNNNWIAQQKIVQGAKELRSFLKSEHRYVLSNIQVRFLGIDHDVIRDFFPVWKNKQDTFILQEYGDYAKEDLDMEACYLAAKTHLFAMKFFGIQERLRESILLMCYTFNKPYPYQIPHLMKFATRPALSSFSTETYSLIDQSNGWGYRLYYEALHTFEKRYMQMCEALASKTGKSINSVVDAIVAYRESQLIK